MQNELAAIEKKHSMFGKLSALEKSSVVMSSCVLAIGALVALFRRSTTTAYSDFIVGNLAWQADAKTQDLLAGPVFIVVLFVGLLYFSNQITRYKEQFGSTRSQELSRQFLWWSLPFIEVLASAITKRTMELNVLVVSGAGILFVSIVVAYHAWKNKEISPTAVGLGVLAILLIGLIPLEIALFLGRLPIKLVGDIDSTPYGRAAKMLVGIGLVTGLLSWLRWPEVGFRVLPRLVLIGQLGLPLFFLTLYPARLMDSNGLVKIYQTTFGLKIFFVAIILLGLWDVVRRYRSFSRAGEENLALLLSPIALFALLITLRIGNTLPPQINADDYHFGERLLGWWSYLQGAIPYVDYIPPHGLADDDLSGFLSFLFYDGFAGSVMEVNRLGYAILACGAFFAIFRYTNSVALACILVAFTSGRIDWWLFLTPFFCLWCSPALMAMPSRWLSVWILTAPVAILGVPAQGLLLVGSSGVIAAFMLWKIWSNPVVRIWREISISLATLFALALFTPLPQMLFCATRFVLENGPINQEAFGVPWMMSLNDTKLNLIFECIRMSWTMVPLACLAVIWINKPNARSRTTLLFPAVVVLLFSLLIIPYAMGRIDLGAVSRPGITAMFGWTILLPMVTWGLLNASQQLGMILTIAGTSAILTSPSLSTAQLVSATSAKISTGPLKYGASAGLNNLGVASVQDEHWQRLTRLNELLNGKIGPGETYLDLTSRNAQYFYLNRRPRVAVTAPYNMASLSQQRRAIELLKRDLPRVALLEDSNVTHDGGGLALRNPLLYRFIIENYVPQAEAGFIIGYRIQDLKSGQAPVDQTKITAQSYEERVSLFEKAFAISDFRKIPVAWGRSERSLEKKMVLVKQFESLTPVSYDLHDEQGAFRVLGVDPQLIFDISRFSLSGRDAGLLKFKFSCINKAAEPRIQVFWWGDELTGPAEASSIRFTATNGTLIVPLDAAPRWFTLNHIRGIRLDLDTPNACKQIQLKDIALYQRSAFLW